MMFNLGIPRSLCPGAYEIYAAPFHAPCVWVAHRIGAVVQQFIRSDPICWAMRRISNLYSAAPTLRR